MLKNLVKKRESPNQAESLNWLTGPTSAGTTIDAAEQMIHEAEEASLRSFHEFTSYWTNERVNVRSSTQAGMFEMVLQSTLRQELVSVLTKFENYTCF